MLASELHQRPDGHRQAGVSLLESLVALLVLALGVLGMLGVQLKSLADNQSATHRAMAVRLAEDLFERIKANPQGLGSIDISAYSANGSWATLATPPASSQCIGSACSASQQATFDVWRWQRSVQQTLPGGNATTFVSPSDPEQLGVMLAWRLRQTDQSTTGSANTERASWLNVDVPGGPACPADSVCHVAYGKP
jgi:type IV pilus assembly protein PilV